MVYDTIITRSDSECKQLVRRRKKKTNLKRNKERKKERRREKEEEEDIFKKCNVSLLKNDCVKG